MLVVTGAVFTLTSPNSPIFQVQGEGVDIQPPLPVGVDTLTPDLIMAGAGAYSGSQSGSLLGFFAPIQPSRQGQMAAYDDGPGTFFPDRITLFYVPSTSTQTSVRDNGNGQGMPANSSELRVNQEQ